MYGVPTPASSLVARKNPDKERQSRIVGLRRWAARNPEHKRELARKSNAKPEISAKNVNRARQWRKDNPDRSAALSQASDRNRRARELKCNGTHSPADIEAILKRQKFRCAECRSSVRSRKCRHVDHIMPLSLGGSNWPSNLQVLCPKCNLRKGAKDPITYARTQGRLI